MSKNSKARELTEQEKEFLAKINEILVKAEKLGTLNQRNIDFALNAMKLLLNPDTTTVVDIEKVFDPNSPNSAGDLFLKIPIPKKFN